MGMTLKDPRDNGRAQMRVIRLIVVNWIAGAILGLAFAGMTLWFDVAGLGGLIMHANPIWAPLLLLAGGFMVLTASLVAGTAIMLIPRDEPPPDDPRGGTPEFVLQPVPVRARVGRKRI